VRRSYLRHALEALEQQAPGEPIDPIDLAFLAQDTGSSETFVLEVIDALRAPAR